MENSRIFSADDMALLPSMDILPSLQAIDDSLFQVGSSTYPTAYVIGEQSYSTSGQNVFRSVTNPEFHVVVCLDRFGNTHLDQSSEGAKEARRIKTFESAMNSARNLRECASHYKREALPGESALDFVRRISQRNQDAYVWANTIAPKQQNGLTTARVTNIGPMEAEQRTLEAVESKSNAMPNLFPILHDSAPAHSQSFADSIVAKPAQAVEHVTDELIAMLRCNRPDPYSMPKMTLQEFSLASQVPIEVTTRSETPAQDCFDFLAALNREAQRLAQFSEAHAGFLVGGSGMSAPLVPTELHADPLPGMCESAMALFATKPTVSLPRSSRAGSSIDSGYGSGTSPYSPAHSARSSSSNSLVGLGPESVEEIRELKTAVRARDEEIDRLKAKLDSFEISGPYIGEYGVTVQYHEDFVNNREESLKREMEEQLREQKEADEKILSEKTSALNKRLEKADKKNDKLAKENEALKKDKHDLEIQKAHLEHVQDANEQLKSEKVELEERIIKLVSQCQKQVAENDDMRTQLADEFGGTQFRPCLKTDECKCLRCFRTSLAGFYQQRQAEFQRQNEDLERLREISKENARIVTEGLEGLHEVFKENVMIATESDRATIKSLGAQ
ncbi:MAG: hypothetical protein Q9165_004077 [Trypethelium subeluteriae]